MLVYQYLCASCTKLFRLKAKACLKSGLSPVVFNLYGIIYYTSVPAVAALQSGGISA